MLKNYTETKPTIITPNCKLRPFVINDVKDLEAWMPDKSLYEFWGKGPSKDDKCPSNMFIKKAKASKSFHLGIEHKASHKVVGDIWVYLIENDRMASVAIRVSPAYQGRGIGAEALKYMTDFCFDKTELQRLQAEIHVDNIASQKIFEKCGYTQEGLIRQGKMVNTWCDYYIYGKLRGDN